MKGTSATLLVLAVMGNPAFASDASEIDGEWEVSTSYAGGSSIARLEIKHQGENYTGESGWLVPDFAPFTYAGSREAGVAHLQVSYGGVFPIGDVALRAERGVLRGSGTIHGVAVSVAGHRPRARPTNAPRIHDYKPSVFYRTLSGAHAPALHVFPGDTIRTETVDSAGLDGTDKIRSLPGNPVTGPFYVEGAMPGDTLAVRFDRIRPNRRWATQSRATIVPGALQPGDVQTPTPEWSDRWTLDLDRGTAKPDAAGEALRNFSVKLQPQLGTVAVAPFWDQAVLTTDLGRWGGNIDYKEIREGTTLYFTVYQAGGLLFIGDGHALQGDGEITGQGLEISMDVEMTVDVLRGAYLDQPWAQNNEYVMVSGIDGSLTTALQAATSGMRKWLAQRYPLNESEIATVLANNIQYDVAEVADAHMHVVAKIRKDVLTQLPSPVTTQLPAR